MRGARGNSSGSDADSTVVVHDFLDRVGKRRPSDEEIGEIRPALESLYDRLVKIRSMSPAYRRVDLSDQVWGLLERIGKRRLPGTRGSIGRAASFLYRGNWIIA